MGQSGHLFFPGLPCKQLLPRIFILIKLLTKKQALNFINFESHKLEDPIFGMYSFFKRNRKAFFITRQVSYCHSPNF